MSWYLSRVKIGYGTKPSDDPGLVNWTNITTSTPGWSAKLGRSTEFDDMEAGTCTFDIYNDSGALTPGRDAGKNLVPWDWDKYVGPRETENDYVTNATVQDWFTDTTTNTLSISGTRGFVFLTSTAVNNEIQMNPLGEYGPIPVTAGLVYSGNVYAAHGTGPESGYGFISWLDENLAELSRSVSSTVAWSTAVGTATSLPIANVTAPAGAYYAVLGARLTTRTAAGTLYFGYPHLQTGASFTGKETMYGSERPLVGNLVFIETQDSGSIYWEMFTGAIESIVVHNVEGSQEISHMTVTAVDVSKYLANINTPTANQLALVATSPTPWYTAYLQDAAVGQTAFSTTKDSVISVEAMTAYGTPVAINRAEGPSVTDYALRFSGGSGSGYVSTSPVARSFASATYSTWFRVSAKSDTTANQYLMLMGCEVSDGSWISSYLQISATTGKVTLGGTSGVRVVTDNQWHHIAVVHTVISAVLERYTIYIDGAQDLVQDYAGTYDFVTPKVRMNLLVEPQAANIDLAYVAQWDSALTATQISALATSAAGALTNATVSSAIGSLLDSVSWPNTVSARSIDTITQTIGGVQGDESVMSAIKRIADSANTSVFIDGSGRLCVRAAENRLYPGFVTTLGETSTGTPEDDLDWSLDDSLLFSKATINGINDATVSVVVTAPYGVREFSTDTALSDATAMQSLANWLLYLRQKQRVRVGQITFNLSAGPSSLWDNLVIWGVADNWVLDLSAVLRTQEPNLQTRYFIESFDWIYDQENLTMKVTCDLSPSKYYEAGLLRLNSSTQGQVGLYRLGL